MRIAIKLFTLIILVMFFSTNIATAIPSIPHRFKGYVFDENDTYVSDGTIITAEINGKYFNTTVKNGKYGYPGEADYFFINGSASDAGDTIYFYINDILVNQHATFSAGGLNVNLAANFNLSFDSSLPVISSISVSSITLSQAKITWTTNKAATSIVEYGKTKTLGSSKADSDYVLNHEIVLTGLDSGTKYYFKVTSYDYLENMASDDNSGNYYSFTTGSESSGDGDDTSPSPGDGDGGDDVESNDDVNLAPVADAGGPYYGRVGEIIYFDAIESEDSDGYIVNYTWDFGDGSDSFASLDSYKSYSYSDVGNYTVTLTVFDDDGAKDSVTTFANISSNDADNDGWSDESEIYYGSDPNNSTNYPVDTDRDGVPDAWDADDDNDGLTDLEEDEIGSNSIDDSDVLRISNIHGIFFLIDLDIDGFYDKYYNKSSNVITDLYKFDENIFLIDVNGDGVYEYYYDSLLGQIDIWRGDSSSQVNDNTLLFGLLFIVILAIIILIIYIIYNKRK